MANQLKPDKECLVHVQDDRAWVQERIDLGKPVRDSDITLKTEPLIFHDKTEWTIKDCYIFTKIIPWYINEGNNPHECVLAHVSHVKIFNTNTNEEWWINK